MQSTSHIPNKIKQPSECCNYCGKIYRKKNNLNKHILVCELIDRNKKNAKGKTLLLEETDFEEELPSQQKMFKILLELAEKYNKLELKMAEMDKFIVKKKNKINVIEWLNTNIVPNIIFDKLDESIKIIEDDVTFLLNNSFYDTLNEVFSRSIYCNDSNILDPIIAFTQKSNIFYVYDTVNLWQELTKERLIKFLNKIHIKIYKNFYDWKKGQNNMDDRFSTICDKTTVNLMNVDFKKDNILSKVRGSMYNKMKRDMKALVEYDFEF